LGRTGTGKGTRTWRRPCPDAPTCLRLVRRPRCRSTSTLARHPCSTRARGRTRRRLCRGCMCHTRGKRPRHRIRGRRGGRLGGSESGDLALFRVSPATSRHAICLFLECIHPRTLTRSFVTTHPQSLFSLSLFPTSIRFSCVSPNISLSVSNILSILSIPCFLSCIKYQ
jgi:hypothetical protein